MAVTTKDDEQNWYICGKCKFKIFYLKSENPPTSCPECGWELGTRNINDVPSEIKLDLSQY